MLSWFAVHPTSVNNTNDLVNGDNKGVASYLFENWKNPGKLPGEGDFVGMLCWYVLGRSGYREGDGSPMVGDREALCAQDSSIFHLY